MGKYTDDDLMYGKVSAETFNTEGLHETVKKLQTALSQAEEERDAVQGKFDNACQVALELRKRVTRAEAAEAKVDRLEKELKELKTKTTGDTK
jgi:polyhydroxyalkanoate synthesis regulator phasin